MAGRVDADVAVRVAVLTPVELLRRTRLDWSGRPAWHPLQSSHRVDRKALCEVFRGSGLWVGRDEEGGGTVGEIDNLRPTLKGGEPFDQGGETLRASWGVDRAAKGIDGCPAVSEGLVKIGPILA